MNLKYRPVFLFIDDYHEVSTTGDESHVSSCRYTMTSVVYATQTINNLTNALGEDAAMMLVAGLRNRFLCRTEDEKTTRWLAASLGQRVSSSLNFGPAFMIATDLNAETLMTLKQGGPDRVVEAVFVAAGDTFKASRRRWLKISFLQEGPKRKKGLLAKFWEYLTSPHVRIVPKGPEGGSHD
jgi:hypothetical protein